MASDGDRYSVSQAEGCSDSNKFPVHINVLSSRSLKEYKQPLNNTN